MTNRKIHAFATVLDGMEAQRNCELYLESNSHAVMQYHYNL